MSNNYTKLVNYLNSLDEADKPPLGVEGPFFDRIVRCAEHLHTFAYIVDYTGWSQPHPYDEKMLSSVLLVLDIDFNNAHCDIEISSDISITVRYNHNESETDAQFIENFNRIFNSEALTRSLLLLRGE